MQTLQINIQDNFYDKFIDFIKTLPQESVTVEKIDNTHLEYPSISSEEARMKVSQSIADIESGNAQLFSEEEVFKLLENS